MSDNILHSSETNEWYTPDSALIPIRHLLGGYIDLDPASTYRANEIVRAVRYYNKEQNGLVRGWKGRVFVNPPYGHQTGKWVNKALSEFHEGRADNIALLVNAVPGRNWFNPLFDYPICFYRKRIRFLDPVTLEPQDRPTNDNALVFIIDYGINWFIKTMYPFGNLFIPARMWDMVTEENRTLLREN